MKKYIWFLIGYIAALSTTFMASCTISPLEASNSELGSSRYNPMYVVCIDE